MEHLELIIRVIHVYNSFLVNNIIGGDNADRLLLFWKIGKIVYENRVNCLNIVEKCSTYYAYLFGSSYMFTRENIWLMEKFYLMFPVFSPRLKTITWEQYKLLFNVNNSKERYFYFYITLFFNFDYDDTKDLINNNYYLRI